MNVSKEKVDSSLAKKDSSNILMFLKVGMQVILDTDVTNKASTRFKTTILGWKKGHYIILDSTGVSQDRSKVLNKYKSAIRFISDGKPCALLVSIVGGYVERGVPYFRVSWPDEFRHGKLRNEERLYIDVPCNVHTEDGKTISCTLRNLSPSGCRFHTPVLLTKGAKIKTTICLPNGTLITDAECEVCHVFNTSKGCEAGCRFLNIDNDSLANLNFYLATRQSLQGHSDRSSSQILILDNQPDKMDKVCNHLENAAYSTIILADSVQAITWIGISCPYAIFVNIDNQTFNVEELCKVIRSSHHYENLPLFLYGDKKETLEKLAKSTNATDYVKSISETSAFIDVLKELQVKDI